MGKKIMRCCVFAASGAMLFGGGLGFGCLGKNTGRYIIQGAAISTTGALLDRFVFNPFLVQQDAQNAVAVADAIAEIRAAE